MPIYEYRCEKCGNVFQYLHRRLNDAAPACPKCGGEVKKLFSTFGAKTGSANCPHEESCAAAGHSCGCGCGCHHHH